MNAYDLFQQKFPVKPDKSQKTIYRILPMPGFKNDENWTQFNVKWCTEHFLLLKIYKNWLNFIYIDVVGQFCVNILKMLFYTFNSKFKLRGFVQIEQNLIHSFLSNFFVSQLW